MNKENRSVDSALTIECSIDSARDGSFSAIGQILDHYRDYLLKVASEEVSSDLGVKVAPSDLVQETFSQAVRDFKGFRGKTEAELRSWLRRILLHNVQDARRRYERLKCEIAKEVPLDLMAELPHTDAMLNGPVPSPSQLMVSAELLDALEKALCTLPAEHRRVVEMRAFDDLSFREIGTQLGTTAEAARKVWERALAKITRKMVEYDSERA
jgi:RNA polymerase sigma-70 factor (ECF subfamily)